MAKTLKSTHASSASFTNVSRQDRSGSAKSKMFTVQFGFAFAALADKFKNATSKYSPIKVRNELLGFVFMCSSK